MARLVAALCFCWLLAGCNSTVKNDNPVFGPSPPRTSFVDAPNAVAIAEAEHLAVEPDPSNVTQAGYQESDPETDLFNSTVVATVNGAPIFAGEVLERHGEELRKAQSKLPEADYNAIREEIIRRELFFHIQQHLLVERTKGELKPEQVKTMREHLEGTFEKEWVEKLKKELKVTTRTELERELNARGTSLSNARNNFVTQGIAYGYMEHKSERPPPIRPEELVDYYHEHEKDYFVPAKVRWQEIQVSYSIPGGQKAAEAKLHQAREELERGVSFAAVVAKYSDGPTKQNDGARDWVNQGSLADEKLEKLLFSMPVNTATEAYFGPRACQLVQVLERTESGTKPFAEVQAEIHEILRRSGPTTAKGLLEELYSQAIIETKYAYVGQKEEPSETGDEPRTK
jgi:hypothetical protein